MIAPLDVHIVKAHQLLHDDISSWPPIENVPDNVEIVNGQVLDQAAQGCDKLVRNAVVDDGMDNFIVIELFILVVSVHMEQLINGVGILLRHLFADLGPGIFG